MHDEELMAKTVGEMLARQATEQPDAPYLRAGEVELSFGELWEQSGRAASGLAALGLGRGDRVTTWMPNRSEWVVAAFALARLGVINVLANPRYRPAELAYLLAHSQSRCLITERPMDDAFEALLADHRDELHTEAGSGLEHRIVLDGPAPTGYGDWATLAEHPLDEAAIAGAAGELDPQDVLYIIYTSGTTGRPKGSMTRHGAALRNAFNSGERMGFGADDRLLCYLTMTHCFGSVNALLNTLTHGCRLDIQDDFTPDRVLATIADRGVTAVYGVPTHFTMLAEAQAAGGDRHDLRTLTKGCCGGGEISTALQDAIDAHLGLSGLTHAYGMSESTAIISQSAHSQPRELRLGTAGAPLPGVEVRLVDAETDEEVATGEPGDVLIRGFNVHAGYFMLDPDPSVRGDGWWQTGDIASFDEHGGLTIRGRSKDMYKTSGFNVYPVEVEALLATHPSVGEVSVVGVPHPRKQEVGAAFIIPAPGAEVDAEEIKAFAREHLVGYKTPEHVFVVEDLPRSNATLKIQKHQLRAQSIELIEAQTVR